MPDTMVLFSSPKSWANVRYCDCKCIDIWGMKKVGEKINEPRARSVAFSLLFYFLPLGPLRVFVFFLLLIMTYSREVFSFDYFSSLVYAIFERHFIPQLLLAAQFNPCLSSHQEILILEYFLKFTSSFVKF